MPSLEEAKNIAWAAFISLLTALVLACICSSIPARADGILFFHSEKCGPCKAMAPEVYKLSEGWTQVVWIDVDKNPEIAAMWKVTSWPTCIAVSEHNFGNLTVRFEEGRLTGRQSYRALRYLADTNIGDDLCYEIRSAMLRACGVGAMALGAY